MIEQHPPVEVCNECGEPRRAIFRPNGGTILWSIQECQKCKLLALKAQLSTTLEEKLRQRGLAPKFQRASISDFPQGIIESILNGRPAFISGTYGTGKTHLEAALLRYYTEQLAIRMNGRGEWEFTPLKDWPLMTSIQEVLLRMRESFGANGSGETEGAIIDEVTAPPILILDDLGVEKNTDWAIQNIYLIVDRRYREEARTFFSSNLTLQELSERLGDRIASRIAGMTQVITMTGKDRRIG